MRPIFAIFFLLIFVAFGCQPEKKHKSNRKIEEINGVPNASEMIRNPISANGIQDTINLPKLQFEATTFDFGKVNEGDKVTHIFNFKNVGNVPLILSDVRSTCGCTVPKWPKEAIPPGKEDKISVVFDTTNKKEKQHKPITITANTYPSKTVLSINGYVIPKK